MDHLSLLKEISLEQSPDAIFWIDQSGKIRYANQTASKRLGYPVKTLLNMHIFDIDPNMLESLWNSHWQYIKKQGASTFESVHQDADGKIFPVEVRVKYVAANGENFNFATASDITDRVEREKKLRNALDEVTVLRKKTEAENEYLKATSEKPSIFQDSLVCERYYSDTLPEMDLVATLDVPVHIMGETGTAKLAIGKYIHLFSPRKDQPFIVLDCLTTPAEIIEYMLFDPPRGKKYWDDPRLAGLLQMANAGTILIHRIDKMPPATQRKLLDYLEKNERPGSTLHKVDVRIITSSSVDLQEMTIAGDFDKQLYEKISVFKLNTIPLRDRKEDISILADYFLKIYATKYGKQFSDISGESLKLLMAYDYKGNLLELENIIERGVLTEEGSILRPGAWLPRAAASHEGRLLTFEEAQRNAIINAVKVSKGRISGPNGAARLLNLNDKTLFSKLERLNIRTEEIN